MTHYNVITPQYTTYYQDEPPETSCDYLSVDAPSKRAAAVEAVRRWTEKGGDWIKSQRLDGRSPFAGLKVEQPLCTHGFCWCDICADDKAWVECAECLAEIEAEVDSEAVG